MTGFDAGPPTDADLAIYEAGIKLHTASLNQLEMLGLQLIAEVCRLREENEDQRQEIARHHTDFARWEEMADKGAARIAKNEALREAGDALLNLFEFFEGMAVKRGETDPDEHDERWADGWEDAWDTVRQEFANTQIVRKRWQELRGTETTEMKQSPSCICPRFQDTDGVRIADLSCPVHGVDGTQPGDGHWEDDQ